MLDPDDETLLLSSFPIISSHIHSLLSNSAYDGSLSVSSSSAVRGDYAHFPSRYDIWKHKVRKLYHRVTTKPVSPVNAFDRNLAICLLDEYISGRFEQSAEFAQTSACDFKRLNSIMNATTHSDDDDDHGNVGIDSATGLHKDFAAGFLRLLGKRPTSGTDQLYLSSVETVLALRAAHRLGNNDLCDKIARKVVDQDTDGDPSLALYVFTLTEDVGDEIASTLPTTSDLVSRAFDKVHAIDKFASAMLLRICTTSPDIPRPVSEF